MPASERGRTGPEGTPFHGREKELESLSHLARDLLRGWGRSLYLWAPPGSGKTALLKQFRHGLFEEREVFPFYYAFPGSAWDLEGFAADFAASFAIQYVDFRRGGSGVRFRGRAGEDAVRILAGETFAEARLLAEAVRMIGRDPSPASAVREAALLPGRFSAETGEPVIALFDDFHHLAGYRPHECARWPREALMGAGTAVVMTGGGPSLAGGLVEGTIAAGALQRRELPPLSRKGAALVTGRLLRVAGAGIAPDLADLVVDLSGGRPAALELLVGDLPRKGTLDEGGLCRAYSASVCRGALRDYWSALLEKAFPGPGERKKALQALVLCSEEPGGTVETGRLSVLLGIGEEDLERLLAGLAGAGLCSAEGAQVTVVDDEILRDYLNAVSGVKAGGSTGAFVEAHLAAEKMERAESGRRRVSLEESREKLREMLASWSGQQIPRSLFHAGEFKKLYGATEEGKILALLGEEESTLTLPAVASTASGALGMGRRGVSGLEADAVAWVFSGTGPGKGRKVLWVVKIEGHESGGEDALEEMERTVGELLSMREAEGAQVVKWCLARSFTAESLEKASRQRILTSTPLQVRHLGRLLGVDGTGVFPAAEKGREPGERLDFEMFIPMVSETELVAARAVEQLAENMSFDTEEIGRIKMALVEACINAFEHSGGEGGRVRLRFTVAQGSLEIRVENRGKPFVPRKVVSTAQKGGELRKRGWGLNLINELMDEVEFEPMEEGTRLVMVKHLKGKEGRSE